MCLRCVLLRVTSPPMRVNIGDARLFFDVEGAKLRPDGPKMREVPTVLLLHGGPGFDHSNFKPEFSRLAEIAQVVYLDHRGNGRSDRPSAVSAYDRAQRTLDTRAVLDAAGVRPRVLRCGAGDVCRWCGSGLAPRQPPGEWRHGLCRAQRARLDIVCLGTTVG